MKFVCDGFLFCDKVLEKNLKRKKENLGERMGTIAEPTSTLCKELLIKDKTYYRKMFLITKEQFEYPTRQNQLENTKATYYSYITVKKQ